ncbi:MAG: cytochrome c, partial [Rhodobacterales bacterium]|nr:cytochrome c [Rhodobacterales bacterium]
HDVGFPFNFRSGLKLWRAAYLDAPKTDALMGTSSPWNRGRLLVEGAAHCAACHTGRTLAGGLDDSARFAGNDSLPGGSKAPSILTADLLERGWTVANMAYALQTGLLPNGDVFGGSMAEVVAEGTSYLTDADREAIATYLLDPAGSGDIPEPAPPVTETPMAGMDHSQMEMGNEN